MTHSGSMAQRVAQHTAVAGVTLAAIGVGAVVLGTALYDGRVLGFPVPIQAAVIVGEIALGIVPCQMLLRAAHLVLREDRNRARSISVTGGIALLPGIAASAVFRAVANPCWDNPGCTGGTSVEDAILTAGLFILLLAAAVALLLSPLLIGAARR